MTDFAPAFGIKGPHKQTLFAAFMRRAPGPRVRRERVELPDGDFLDLDVATPDEPAQGMPWVIVLHGLEGSSVAPYARGLGRALLERGIEACLINYRGCSGEDNRLPRSYHMGETGDVRFVIEKLAAERPGRPFAVVGFSCGANLTMKLLGEAGDSGLPNLSAGVAISPPFDLALASRNLDSPRCTPYRVWLVSSLRKKALLKLDKFPGIADRDEVARARTFRAFDRSFTARLHGFRDEEDYWEKCSGSRYLPAIRRDVLIISALDDPFFPPGYVPRDLIAQNPRATLLAVDHGGHVAFVGGSALRPTFWAEERAVEFVAARLSSGARVGVS